jgi:hypothetical protein
MYRMSRETCPELHRNIVWVILSKKVYVSIISRLSTVALPPALQFFNIFLDTVRCHTVLMNELHTYFHLR